VPLALPVFQHVLCQCLRHIGPPSPAGPKRETLPTTAFVAVPQDPATLQQTSFEPFRPTTLTCLRHSRMYGPSMARACPLRGGPRIACRIPCKSRLPTTLSLVLVRCLGPRREMRRHAPPAYSGAVPDVGGDLEQGTEALSLMNGETPRMRCRTSACCTPTTV